MSRSRSAMVVLILLLLPGCGPLMIPAVQRLPEEEQQKVDSGWNNMLSPVARLDRQTLLDTLIMFQLHQRGVDRLVVRSEKIFAEGAVVMEIHFDRANEKVDRYDVSIYDSGWELQRRESYRPKEITQAIEDLYRGDGDQHHCRRHPSARELALEARLRAVAAATQPAGSGP